MPGYLVALLARMIGSDASTAQDAIAEFDKEAAQETARENEALDNVGR